MTTPPVNRPIAIVTLKPANVSAPTAAGHRANGFTTDGGFAEYAINHVNTMVHIPDQVSDEEATLIVTAGTAMYGLDVMGGLIAGESVVVTGPGPIGLMGVGVAKLLGATPVILTGTRERRLQIGRRLGADHIVNVTEEDPVEAIARITGGRGVQYVLECSGAPAALDQSARMAVEAASGSPPFPTKRCWWTSPISCATTSTYSASAAKGRARRIEPPLSSRRSGSTPS